MQIIAQGIDIVVCERIGRIWRDYGKSFLDRIYTPAEQDYCINCKTPVVRLAGRFAAKEAVLKALGTGWTRGISWRDVEILNEPGGRPVVVLRGGARRAAQEQGITQMLVSISHCRTHATAYALAVGEEPGD